MRYSKTAFNNGINEKTISNLYEAFLGAAYLVFGINGAFEFANQTLLTSFRTQSQNTHSHPKNVLQEYFQQSSNSKLEYITEKLLPSNNFGSVVFFEGEKYGEGIGKSKKEAETNAAIDALSRLQK